MQCPHLFYSQDLSNMFSSVVVDALIAAKGCEYPFNELSATRRGYRCRWILLRAPCDHNVLRIGRMERLHAVPSHCFHDDILQEMFYTDKALPFTNVMADVLDVMERWGRGKCLRWHDCCVRYMAWRLESKMCIDAKCLYFALIKLRVKDMVLFGNGHRNSEHVHYQWVIFCNHCCDYDSHDYFELALRSFHFVRALLENTTATCSPGASVVSS